MLKRIDYKHQPKPVPLTKQQSTYNKLQREMNEPAKDYNSIKQMIENENNDITKIKPINNQSKTITMIAHKKK